MVLAPWLRNFLFDNTKIRNHANIINYYMAKAKGGWGVSVTIEATPKKTRQGTGQHSSILRLVEIKSEEKI